VKGSAISPERALATRGETSGRGVDATLRVSAEYQL